MSELRDRPPHAFDVPELWERIETAGSKLLILDYDGTLAPFVVDRMEAFPLDGIRTTLQVIRDEGSTHLAIVTGRPVREILALLGDLGVPIAGSQGSEFRYPDGRWFTLLPTAKQCARLVRAEREALEFSPRDRVERKPTSVALHTRGVAEPEARRRVEAVCGLWERDSAEIGFECRRFLGGIEIRLRDVTKGTAVRSIVAGHSRIDAVVYVGDDETDEDAFRELKGTGFSIRVGDMTTITCADALLRDVADVRGFLAQWYELARGSTAPEQERTNDVT